MNFNIQIGKHEITKQKIDQFLKDHFIKTIKVWVVLGLIITFFISGPGFLYFLILGLMVYTYELKLKEIGNNGN